MHTMQATTRNSANVMISLLHSSFEYCSMLNVLLLRDFVTDLQNEINKRNETISGERCYLYGKTRLYLSIPGFWCDVNTQCILVNVPRWHFGA